MLVGLALQQVQAITIIVPTPTRIFKMQKHKIQKKNRKTKIATSACNYQSSDKLTHSTAKLPPPPYLDKSHPDLNGNGSLSPLSSSRIFSRLSATDCWKEGWTFSLFQFVWISNLKPSPAGWDHGGVKGDSQNVEPQQSGFVKWLTPIFYKWNVFAFCVFCICILL